MTEGFFRRIDFEVQREIWIILHRLGWERDIESDKVTGGVGSGGALGC